MAQKTIEEQKWLARLLATAKAWNDRKLYPAKHNLERHFNKRWRAIHRELAVYDKYRKEHPEAGLPPLVLRRNDTGYVTAMSAGILQQLEVFRVDAKKLAAAQTLIVTSAQLGASLMRSFWASLMQYEKERDAFVVVMSSEYGSIPTLYNKSTSEEFLLGTYPDELKERVLLGDFPLPLSRGKLMLNNDMRLRPTLQRFLTDTVCEMGGPASQIFAAPMLELEFRPRLGHNSPKGIMTTGSCTYPNYHVNKLGKPDRTGGVAIKNHDFAAIVVEIESDGSFHFRQLHANSRGEFYDINPRTGGADLFTPQGVRHCPKAVSALVCGDWHTGKTSPEIRRGTFGEGSMTKVLKPKHIVLHDLFDGDSISPHEEDQSVRAAYKPSRGWDNLEKELEGCVAELKWMGRETDAMINVVASNHPEFLDRYIEKRGWTKDNLNFVMCARLFLMMSDDLKARHPKKFEAAPTDPFILWIRKHCPNVRMLERQEVLLLPEKAKKRILCSLHGDQGVRGGHSRGTKEFRKLNQPVILGHNHTGAILGPVWRVGVSMPLMVHYIQNPTTNWTNTHCVIFDNGQRQLVNFVKGRWYGKKWDC